MGRGEIGIKTGGQVVTLQQSGRPLNASICDREDVRIPEIEN